MSQEQFSSFKQFVNKNLISTLEKNNQNEI